MAALLFMVFPFARVGMRTANVARERRRSLTKRKAARGRAGRVTGAVTRPRCPAIAPMEEWAPMRIAANALFRGAALVLAAALAPSATARAAEESRIVVAGTGAGLATLQALAGEYAKSAPGVTIRVLPSLGSGGGIKAVRAGLVQVAVSARPLSEAERAHGLREVPLARTPFVIATGLGNSVGEITLAELAAMYEGSRTRWPDGQPVRPVLRPADDIDTRLLGDMSPGMERAAQAAARRPGMNVASTDAAAASALETVPGAIGATSLSLVVSERRRLKALRIDGREPTLESLAAGSYPFVKTLTLVTAATPAPQVEAFLRFVGSPRGAQLLHSLGSLPSR